MRALVLVPALVLALVLALALLVLVLVLALARKWCGGGVLAAAPTTGGCS
ncbi:hypothetical protein [Micromonospora sp. WMMD737]